MAETQMTLPHKLALDQRNNLTMSGVTEVVRTTILVILELRRYLNLIVPRGVFFSFIGTSGSPLKVPTIIPYYCTPFFARCKEKFCTLANFFQNKTQREEQKTQDFPHQPPKAEKNRRKPQPHCPPANSHSQEEAEGVAHPQVPSAEVEGGIHPANQGSQYETPVCQGGELGAQWPQETVKHPQTHPDEQ